MKRKILRAGSLIEFVCVLPLMLMLLTGIIDYCFMLYDKSVITNASREGARYGIVRRSPTYASMASVITYATNNATNNLVSFSGSSPAVTVTATSSTSTPTSGSTLTVKVSYVYTDLLLHYFIGGTGINNLSSTTVMTYE